MKIAIFIGFILLAVVAWEAIQVATIAVHCVQAIESLHEEIKKLKDGELEIGKWMDKQDKLNTETGKVIEQLGSVYSQTRQLAKDANNWQLKNQPYIEGLKNLLAKAKKEASHEETDEDIPRSV